MHELISHPGVQFYIHRLDGILRYKLTIADRAPKEFELNDAEFKDTSPHIKCEGGTNLQGTVASALGLEMRLVKNDGVLDVKFEGSNGGAAEWRFVGVQEQGRIVGMAGTQTEGPIMVESEAQTQTKRMRNAQVQTSTSYKDIEALQRFYRLQRSQLAEQAELIAQYAPKDEWKDPWPRHIFMTGRKNAHKVATAKGNRGMIHIDRKTVEVDDFTDTEPGSTASRYIRVWRKANSVRCKPHTIIVFSISIDKETQLWANNDKVKNSNPDSSFKNVDIIIEEIRRCIDKTTGRPCSVPNPKSKRKFKPAHSKRKLEQKTSEESAPKKARSEKDTANISKASTLDQYIRTKKEDLESARAELIRLDEQDKLAHAMYSAVTRAANDHTATFGGLNWATVKEEEAKRARFVQKRRQPLMKMLA